MWNYNQFCHKCIAIMLICLALWGLSTVVCQALEYSEERQTASLDTTARSATDAPAVEVKALDDPGNPYTDLYRGWDQWIFANMVPAPKDWKQGEYPEDWDSLSAEVDENGYMIPMLESTRLTELAICEGKHSEHFDSVSYVYGEGVLPEDIVEGLVQETNRIRASFTPQIPTWLVENPPAMAMLFPNGDVITLSELGDSGKDCCSGKEQVWYRYSNTGELTGQSDVTWWEIYYSEKHGKENWPDGDFENRMDGYVLFKDRVTDQILSCWDYDGTRLESKVPPPFRDPHPFMYLNRYFIIAFYEMQNSDTQ